MAFFDDGINEVTNVKRVIYSDADFKGIANSAIEAPVRIATIKALGANPILIPHSGLYTAL